MKYTDMEFIREELVRRGIIENGFIGEVNPSKIRIEGLEIEIYEQPNNFILLEDERNRINIITDNKYNILEYIISVSAYSSF